MAYTAITNNTTTHEGLALVPVAGAHAGNKVANASTGVMVYIKNTSGSVTTTVTFQADATLRDVPVQDVSKAIAPGEEWIFGPLVPDVFNQTGGDDINFTRWTYDSGGVDMEIFAWQP